MLVPAPTAPLTVPPSPSGLLALSPTVLVVAAADGLWRSTDAGGSWQRTLAIAGRLGSSAVGPAGSGVVAATTPVWTNKTTLHVSDDAVHWRDVTPLMVSGGPADLSNDTVSLEGTDSDAVGFAYPDVRDQPPGGRPMLRTADGGRHWAPVAGTVTDLARVPGSTILFAAAAFGPATPTCDGHLIRSDDNGQHWSAVASSCTLQNVFSVDFVDEQHGFAAGGSPNHYAGSQLLLATDDGGRSWQLRFSTGPAGGGGEQYPDGFAQVRFRTVNDGLALSGACVGGGDGPCGGGLWRTSDGGRSWHDTGLLGVELAGAGTTAVLTGSYATQAGLAISSDGGASWSRTVASADLAIGGLARTSRGLTAVTNDGVELSVDGGLHWQLLPLPVKRHSFYDLAVDGSHGLVTSHQFRLSWRPTTTATPVAAQGMPHDAEIGVGEMALSAQHDDSGLAVAAMSYDVPCGTDVFGTTDGGRSWTSRGSLEIAVNGPIGYDGPLSAAVGECAPASEIGYPHTIALSRDDGHDWSLSKLGAGYDLIAASVAGSSVWVMGADTKGNRVVLVSQDAGASWTANELVGATVGNDSSGTIVALSPNEAVLTDGDSTLWRTTDNGLTWRQERPALPTR